RSGQSSAGTASVIRVSSVTTGTRPARRARRRPRPDTMTGRHREGCPAGRTPSPAPWPDAAGGARPYGALPARGGRDGSDQGRRRAGGPPPVPRFPARLPPGAAEGVHLARVEPVAGQRFHELPLLVGQVGEQHVGEQV